MSGTTSPLHDTPGHPDLSHSTPASPVQMLPPHHSAPAGATTSSPSSRLQRAWSATTSRHPHSPFQQCLTPSTQQLPRNLSLSQLSRSTSVATTAGDHGTRPRSRTAGEAQALAPHQHTGDESRFVPLAHGWYEGFDPQGRKYYLHRQRRVTQWDVPDELLPYLPPLPAGWAERKDAHGHTFYVNVAQKKSQRARPGPHDTELHHAVQRQEHGRQRERSPLPPVQTDDLEPGWKVVLNGAVRRAYFYHPARGITQWSVPTVHKTLPDGWDLRLDYETHRRFYVHVATKRTQWKPPTESSL